MLAKPTYELSPTIYLSCLSEYIIPSYGLLNRRFYPVAQTAPTVLGSVALP
jgi:hypothetical protein